jgi:uncharacterized delta-60 repeat protein
MSDPARLTVDPALRPGLPDLSFDPGSVLTPGYTVSKALAVDHSSRVLFSLQHTAPGGGASSALVRLNPDGTLDRSFSAPGCTYAPGVLLVLPNGQILCAGSGDPPLILLNSDGTTDSSFATPFESGSSIQSVCVQPDGRFIVTGVFTRAASQQDGVLRLTAQGELDSEFQPMLFPHNPFCSPPFLAHLQPDGAVLLWGSINDRPPPDSIHCFSGSEIIRLNSDGTRDPGFVALHPAYRAEIRTFAFQEDGKILVGSQNGLGEALIRLGRTGVLDPSFNVKLTGQSYPDVQAIVVQPDQRILIAGMFEAVNGVPRNHVARLFPDGTLDAGFDPGSGAEMPFAAWPVWSLALTPTGDIVAAGEFTSFNGVPRKGLVRLHGHELPLASPYLSGSALRGASFRFDVCTQRGPR